MVKAITNRLDIDNQLIVIGIELVSKVFDLAYSSKSESIHITNAVEVAKRWNKIFIDEYILPMEGVKPHGN